MAVVLITGGTGMIGKALTNEFVAKGYSVIILTRNIRHSMSGQEMQKSTPKTGKISYAEWNVEEQTIDILALQQADYIIHLAGASVAEKRWTEKRKKEIVQSRTRSAALLVKALKENPNKVKAVASASAIGWYGANQPIAGSRPFMEADPADEGFLGQACQLWEESITPVEELGIRLIKIRIGIVLSNEGGVLAEFKKPLRFGIAGILGSGKQVVSWIHIDDLARIFLYVIEKETSRGIYNAVAPHPVKSKELTLQLAKIQRGSFYVPIHVPAFILRLLLGQMSIEILKSARVSCDKIHRTGFTFLYPDLTPALENVCQPAKAADTKER